MDTQTTFWVDKLHTNNSLSKEDSLQNICSSWPGYKTRLTVPDADWVESLSQYVNDLVTQRIDHVQAWVDSNLSKFGKSNAAMEELHRTMDSDVVEMKRAVQLCKLQCSNCQLSCLNARFHEGEHNCLTDHACTHWCQFEEAHVDGQEMCSLPYVPLPFSPETSLTPPISAGHSGEHV